MDRSLKLRTLMLIGALLFCIATLAPSFVSRDSLPSWFTRIFSKRINYGLDLQGGLHIVYSIDLAQAVDDKASENKRDLEAQFADAKIAATVKAPAATFDVPHGAFTINLTNVATTEELGKLDAAKRAEREAADAKTRSDVQALIETTFGKDAEKRDCAQSDGANALCYVVSQSFADSTRRSALTNAVSTIRERINEKGVAEPTVVEKGDEILVELPGIDAEMIQETRDIIARTAKLEMKVVDDGSQYMQKLYAHVMGHDPSGKVKVIDPDAIKDEVTAEIDQWHPEEGGANHTDWYLLAPDRVEAVTVAEAKTMGCFNKTLELKDNKVHCNVTGRRVIERYMKALIAADPTFKVPDDHQLGFELVDPAPEAKDQRTFWRTYYLDRAVRLTGSAISSAQGSYNPNTNRPEVIVEFNRFGSRVFGDLTSQVIGKKVATILDDKVKSAPIINTAIRGGRASITMGGSNVLVQERERDALVSVLKTGSLPAPLREESASKVGPSLGRDAIDKTKLSFGIGILLVVIIMVGIYRWSGWIAVFAVVFHIIMTLAVMAVFGATLTLPGIAAIVLSIGMEVDGNILIYERIRDELLLGKSVRGAVDLGFSRAFSAILDGQLTTAAAGWVLLQYGSGPIKGFAVMLLVGVFTTLTTNIWVTRIFFDWYIARKKGALATISI